MTRSTAFSTLPRFGELGAPRSLLQQLRTHILELKCGGVSKGELHSLLNQDSEMLDNRLWLIWAACILGNLTDFSHDRTFRLGVHSIPLNERRLPP